MNKSLFTAIKRSTGNTGGCGCAPSAEYNPLYNGNISAMSVNIGKLNNPLLYNYQYDQLNRLVAMDAFTGLNETNNTWNALTTDNSYQERLSYDANGNIKTYLRNGTSATLNLNNYNYSYQSGSNRLLSIQNSVNSQTSNYDYDAIGNVIKDDKQNVTANEWNVYGKLQNTQKSDRANITYTYDAGGNRISKTVSGSNGYTEWYVRDASGNIMAAYTVASSDSLYQSEQHLYGSNRLGIFDRNLNADASLPAGTNANLIGKYYVSFSTRGKKQYEFFDQRGSVLLTVSDKKIPYSSNGSTIDYYNANIISATDYSAFGAISRSFNAGLATNAFDGQRLSPEISATAQTAQFWEYNGDVGRRWNLDPKPTFGISEYASFFNNPILVIDLLGDSGKPKIKLVSPSEIVPRYNLKDQNYIKDLNQSAANNKNKKDAPLISVTGALTLGEPGTFAFEGNILGVKAGLSQSINELDVLSVRDNQFYGAGKNVKTGERERRSGFGVGVIGYGTEQYGEKRTSKDGKITFTIKRDYNVPILTYSTEKDEKGKVESSFSTPIVHIKLGFIVGAELGVKFNYPEGIHVATPTRTNYEISESTSAGLPKIPIYQIK